MNLIPELIALSPFYSPFTPLRNLYLPPQFALIHITLWIPLAVLIKENCFTINLGFSLLFWGCRILNVTVTQHQNPEAIKLIQIFRSLLNSWHQWTLKKKQIQKVPCLHGNEAPSWNQQFQCKKTHTYSSAKQQHKNKYYKRCYLKPYQTHRHHNTHHRTIHCTS